MTMPPVADVHADTTKHTMATEAVELESTPPSRPRLVEPRALCSQTVAMLKVRC